MKKRIDTKKMALSAMMLALAYVLPFVTGQIPEIGNMLCPMHIPVLLCGFLCGVPYGLVIGFFAPLLRSLILGMPPMFPKAICMAFELAVYGMMSGYMHNKLPTKKGYIYLSLVTAMIAGRIVWGGAMYLCMGISTGAFGFSAFLAGAVTNAIPGIIIQLILIPIVVIFAENQTTYFLFDKKRK